MSSLCGSNNGRVALPYLNSGRSLEPAVSSSGRAPVVPVTRAIPEPTDEEEEEDEEESAEEGELPVTRLLGMNPAVPAAMRRRRWALEDYNVGPLYQGVSCMYRQNSAMQCNLAVWEETGCVVGGLLLVTEGVVP